VGSNPTPSANSMPRAGLRYIICRGGAADIQAKKARPRSGLAFLILRVSIPEESFARAEKQLLIRGQVGGVGIGGRCGHVHIGAGHVG
jgi:hypothetical protein